MENFHTIVIGGGPGGAKAAEIIAKSGKSVALIAPELGGECVNYGCIPAKVYLWAADLAEKISGAGQTAAISCGAPSAAEAQPQQQPAAAPQFAPAAAEAQPQQPPAGAPVRDAPKIDWRLLQKRKAEVVSKLQKGLRFTLERAGVKIIEGRAVLENANAVRVTGDAEDLKLTAQFIIVAAGSEPIIPQPFAGKVLTNHEILDLPEAPKTLLIIGGGVIAVEFASIFSALGSQVTIAESAERLLPREDAEISAELERIFARKSIKIFKNTKIAPEQTIDFEKTLIAIGRKPLADIPGLDKTGVRYSQKGIETSGKMQTNIPNIFAVGDVAGKAMLAYTAEREGEIAAAAVLGQNPEPLRYDAVPRTIFCIPEISAAGLTEEAARNAGIDYAIGKTLYSANSKALIMGCRDGFVKIIVDKKTRKILGAHIIGEKASELIAEASLAISADLTMEQFKKNLHSHPVLAEMMKDACKNALTAM